ncbi:MAG: SUMF1/EgtB/PvdO family nonheme iron enzyme, partial [Kiritimatiellae bacterium]|nr:SUMF1/EgtB/PvdO family nonheme iron enzyme [Kiritimatiellia bacterium]
MKAKLSIMGLGVAALALTACAADATASAQGAAGRKTGDVKTITLPGGATMEMVWCEPGTFKMGSPPTETGRFEDEAQHVVKITRGFWLGKYEVTQRQWESVMHSNLSR